MHKRKKIFQGPYLLMQNKEETEGEEDIIIKDGQLRWSGCK